MDWIAARTDDGAAVPSVVNVCDAMDGSAEEMPDWILAFVFFLLDIG